MAYCNLSGVTEAIVVLFLYILYRADVQPPKVLVMNEDDEDNGWCQTDDRDADSDMAANQ